ncbi:MAG: DUF655 domain-containing protein [Candidatus Hydrothermarchaeales archaeon]
MGMEEYAIILDYLPTGHSEDERPIYKREPVAYGVGDKYLSLLELIPKKDVELDPGERVYIGKDDRDKIDYVKRRVEYDDLTAAAISELPYVVEKIVEKEEKRFVDFFNQSRPISTRYHQIELLPGIGNRLMWEILDERKKKPFESFKDISNRVKAIHDPGHMIVKRIVLELEGGKELGKGKYKLFTAPPIQKEESRPRRRGYR